MNKVEEMASMVMRERGYIVIANPSFFPKIPLGPCRDGISGCFGETYHPLLILCETDAEDSAVQDALLGLAPEENPDFYLYYRAIAE